MPFPAKSPLLFPVRLKGSKILVLDETALPFEEKYIEVSSLKQALWVLEQMKTRSLGQVFLFFYSCLLFAGSKPFETLAEKFKEKRPTFDFFSLAGILNRADSFTKDTRKSIELFAAEFDEARKKRAEYLSRKLKNKSRILTICNVNGELIYLYYALRQKNKEVFFYVSETRPYLQGSRLTFWELNRENIPCYLICDSQAARLMKEGKVNAVITGADRASLRGGIINKTGTYALAVLARYFNIPFFALIQYPLDIDITSVKIEQRPGREVFMYLERQISCPAFYPAFDIIEGRYITEAVKLGLKL